VLDPYGDIAAVEAELKTALASDPVLAAEPMGSLLAAGGQRLRPLLVVLCGRLGRHRPEPLLAAAVAVELTHAATLVHDDVIDRSATRRGRPTVAAVQGAESAILIESAFFAESAIFIESLIAGAGAGAIAAGVVSAALSLVFAHAETASTPAANRAKRFIDVLLRVGLGFEQQWSGDAIRVLVVGG